MADDELTLEPPPSGRKVRKKPQPEDKLRSDSVTVRLEGLFEQEYLRRWNIPYYQTAIGRDRKQLKGMAEALGEETAAWVIREFFKLLQAPEHGGDLAFSARCRHGNVGDLAYQTNFLLQRRQRGPQLAQRTADNVGEIMKATGRAK